VRNFILANSATIVQDDSGIPLAYYNRQKWKFFPFGRYAGPISEFPGKYQEQYAELFRHSQPMDFGIGYRWRSHESNLLLSVKMAPDETGPVETTSSADPPEQAKPPRPHKPRPAPAPVAQPRGFFWFGR
jgi:hypothetical protein